MRLMGVPITDDDVQRLATTLMASDVTARTLSARNIHGLQRHVTVLALSPAEPDLLLAVLEVAESVSLAELSGVLANDLAYRRGMS